MTPEQLSKDLRALSNAQIATHSQRFFKTGKGEYGEGDQFLGIRVPVLRQHAKKYQHIALSDVLELLKSVFHEERLCALLLLVYRFAKSSAEDKQAIYQLYLDNTRYINNWDLVDSSAHHIVGSYLFDQDRQILYKLVKSKDLWQRRIAIIATFYFIKHDQFDDTLKLSQQLLSDKQDLIHKAVGWMLREIGKRDIETEKAFLQQHYKNMPRTMLRYAIEKFPTTERKRYLEGGI